MSASTQRFAWLPSLAHVAQLVMVALVASCEGAGGDADVTLPLAELPCQSVVAPTGIWESSPFPATAACGDVDAGVGRCCPWARLPADAVLTMAHGLGRAPVTVHAFIAFDAFGVGSTPASGDSLRILSVSDTEIVLENRTDQRFYVRVALE